MKRNVCEHPRRGGALLGEDGDHVVALGRGRPLPRVRLTVNLLLHKEMSLLLEVDVAVRAGVAVGVTELVSQLHHHPAGRRTEHVLNRSVGCSEATH